jgi:L-ascorbate metabolism protein UlaG (beta-lactamase superfamily)
MKRLALTLVLVISIGMSMATAADQSAFEKDVIKTSAGDVEITFIGHASLMLGFNGKIIHIDPFGQLANYTKLPKADMILITHEHFDHFDAKALQAVRTTNSIMILTKSCAQKAAGGIVMTNGDVRIELTIKIEAVPAYNIVNQRAPGQPYHPKGQGNGYILTIGDKRIYIAGDTENTPEMKSLKNIDCAFLPMNLPYTMTPEMVADAARAFKPRILYPYHYSDTDPSLLVRLLKDTPAVEVRIRRMK